ncbi:hypothetical protein AB0M23_28510 [Streptomyces sp. NPDC052077]|uniref:hypothetical protein n=1 Tax=Streptomyces sp. NPDC052077 TaxID=3154757 RepID=UPI00343F89E7
MTTPPPPERWALQLLAVLADLDRCEHGRHEGDPGSSCGGPSRGNPHTGPGHGRYGHPVVLPPRHRKHDPAAWRTTTTREDPST